MRRLQASSWHIVVCRRRAGKTYMKFCALRRIPGAAPLNALLDKPLSCAITVRFLSETTLKHNRDGSRGRMTAPY